ncbi:DUF6377 domain-containing protein [Flavobacterium hydrophilum]|uniref:Transcriptional regulator n=1 Tax=Flavobacterium hydrophilum TaxID=2211445 RepID=A0A2V4C1I6_9FLAO|nr:DUF6377 domain-containing protein [Flavobacterium hydrophilum]PXY45166.1 transcriptional regulator [Flavobacterium hydrophilum]
MKYKSLFALILILALNTGYANSEVDSLINVLQKEISNSKIYIKTKEDKIANLKSLLTDEKASLNNQYFIINKIIDEYQYYSFDRALLFTEKNLDIAKKLKDKYKISESQLKLSRLLVDSGRYKEALDILKDIKRSNLNDNLLNIYYFNQKEAYSGLNFYTMVKINKNEYRELYYKYEDSLSKRIALSSAESMALLEKKYRDERKLPKALEINTQRLKNTKIGTREYSMVTFERSILYELLSDVDNQKKFLILSAISDIKSNVKDNASLSNLAMILYSEKDIDQAHQFISFSMEDAKFYNSQLRYVNISNVLTSITKAYDLRSSEQKFKLKTFLILISLLGLLLLAVVVYVYKQKNKISLARNNLKEANEQLNSLNKELNIKNDDLNNLYMLLSKSNDIKVHYIGTFLNLYSEYIDKLDVYRKLVTKYITANKSRDLLDLTKSKQVIDTELKLFYKNFDESFLQIYPNFITEFNKLLKEEDQIVLKNNDEILNTELRIYALIRLGITNSSKISKILRYSVNTIYNFRVKIKNSAINREEFENQVKKIA